MKCLPIPAEIAEEAREKCVDRFGHELQATNETAPCRVCLRIPSEPEELILMSYQPLPDRSPYAEVGPIFVHSHRCRPYSDVQTFPADFAARPLVLRAYGYDGRIIDARVAEPGRAFADAADFLTREEVAEIHVRHVSYTCFDFKIVRSDGGSTE
ncbi:MAG: DUF1203 domain-containing protein [Candidatus Cybelea sp.]